MSAATSFSGNARRSPITPLCASAVLLTPGVAHAHVKWFASYDLFCPPRPPLQLVFGEYFLAFCALVLPLMFAVALVDRSLAWKQSWPHRRAEALTASVARYFPAILRIGVSMFFVSLVISGGMILTPELKTADPWVRWVQLAIGLLVLSHRTQSMAGVGIVLLYAHAVNTYGVFHMLDYPIFLGVAAYLMLDSIYRVTRPALAFNVLRITTGITLLWASVEKWAFPEWSYAILLDRPEITFGLSPEFYMVAAGFVEFCAAFLLITGALSGRAAAALLLVFFVSAIATFGRVDAIGHAVIIVVLVMLVLGRNSVAPHFDVRSRLFVTASTHAAMFFGLLVAFVAMYYGGHYLSFRI
ncbi:MAG: DoxX family membrane protein [Burkholderiales bacterium]